MIVLCLEIGFRLGLYEPLAKPGSHAGTSIAMKRALNELGYRNIDYITLGDSRAGCGIDSSTILQASLKLGKRHISMAMPGSYFTTYAIESRLLHEDFANLKGVLFAVSSGVMSRIFNGYYELGIIQPLRNERDFAQIAKIIPFRMGNQESYGVYSAFLQYREDLKEMLFHPTERIRSLRMEKPAWPDSLARPRIVTLAFVFSPPKVTKARYPPGMANRLALAFCSSTSMARGRSTHVRPCIASNTGP